MHFLYSPGPMPVIAVVPTKNRFYWNEFDDKLTHISVVTAELQLINNHGKGKVHPRIGHEGPDGE